MKHIREYTFDGYIDAMVVAKNLKHACSLISKELGYKTSDVMSDIKAIPNFCSVKIRRVPKKNCFKKSQVIWIWD